MNRDLASVLKCPHCGVTGLVLNSSTCHALLPARGEASCAKCAARFPIRDYVLDLAQAGDMRLLTIAGKSNSLPVLPWGYENVWRPRSLTLLTSHKFSVVREIDLIDEWLAARPGELIIDLGSSTDLYARNIGKRHADTTIVAIDMAKEMLVAGKMYAQRQGVENVAHIRAPAQRLPFGDGTVDALMCGGSLNEFRSMHDVLVEARRVCKPGGRMVTMSLRKAESLPGRIGQQIAGLSGIQFPTLAEFDAAIKAAGWQCKKRQVLGVVVFTLMVLKEG